MVLKVGSKPPQRVAGIRGGYNGHAVVGGSACLCVEKTYIYIYMLCVCCVSVCCFAEISPSIRGPPLLRSPVLTRTPMYFVKHGAAAQPVEASLAGSWDSWPPKNPAIPVASFNLKADPGFRSSCNRSRWLRWSKIVGNPKKGQALDGHMDQHLRPRVP